MTSDLLFSRITFQLERYNLLNFPLSYSTVGLTRQKIQAELSESLVSYFSDYIALSFHSSFFLSIYSSSADDFITFFSSSSNLYFYNRPIIFCLLLMTSLTV